MDLPVDTIIERVLFRNNSQHYDYLKPRNKAIPSQHLRHYQLQQQKIALQDKLRKMKLQFSKKSQTTKKEDQIKQNIDDLKKQIQEIVDQNARIQKQLSRIRLKNGKDNSGEVSNELSRSRRECSCASRREKEAEQPRQSRQKQDNRNHRIESKLINSMESPIKSILKTTKNASTNCELTETPDSCALGQKKKHIQALRAIISHQENLISSYQEELNAKNTHRCTTIKPQQLERPTSVKTFKAVSSVGSIVKVKRN